MEIKATDCQYSWTNRMSHSLELLLATFHNQIEVLVWKKKMASTSWDKFKLLLWKNWIIQSRHKVQTVFEIILPVMFMSLLLLIRYLVDPEGVPEPIYYTGEPVETLERFEWVEDVFYLFTQFILSRLCNVWHVRLCCARYTSTYASLASMSKKSKAYYWLVC